MFGPPIGTVGIIFVDDVNMPEVETYGAQPPIELLRQLVDCGGYYDLKEKSWVRIVDTVASGVKVSGASSGGQLNQQTNEVVWSIPEIPGGDSVKLSLEVVPSTIGTLRNTATAVANCAPSVSAETTTRIEGIPAILLEVVDIEDPIEVGENVTYMVTVTNQGSAQGTNIRIECTLENSMQYVSSAGATMATPLENKIVFDALPTLKPKARASWKIVVRAAQSGDVRFMVKMTSDQISRHVVETEATNFYK